MFLLPSIAFGFLLAVLLGGKPSRLRAVRFRFAGAVFGALALQIVLFTALGDGIPAALRQPLHLASYALLVAFALANLRPRALLPLLGGMALNAIAIAANGGAMPLSRTAAEAAGVPLGSNANVSESAERLRFLGDVFALPNELPLANAFSLGDILIACGAVYFIVSVSLGDAGARPLDPRRMLGPMRLSSYRRLAAGRLLSHFGDWLTIASLIGWIYDETGSTRNVVLIMLARLGPPMLGGGLASYVVDRLPKHRLIAAVEIARGMALVGAIAGTAIGSLPAVVGALAASGALAALSNAAVPALVPTLLPPESLAPGNAGLGIARDLAMGLGAAGGGLMLALVGVSAALAVDLATFLGAALVFSTLPAVGSDGRRPERAPGGLRYLLSRRSLCVIVAAFATAALATGLANATLPRFLDDAGLGAHAYGYGLAAVAAGLVLGQALVGIAPSGAPTRRWIGLGLLGMAGLFGLLGLTDHGPTALLWLAFIGFVDGTTDVTFETTVQREADAAYLGAVFGLSSILVLGTSMVAFAIAPALNSVLSSGEVVLGGAVALAFAGVAAVGRRRRDARAPLPLALAD